MNLANRISVAVSFACFMVLIAFLLAWGVGCRMPTGLPPEKEARAVRDSAKPELLLHDAARLEAVRERYRAGKADVVEIVNRLQTRAQELLSARPPSVMDKPLTPSGGDKHDYMSMSAYWWPNPDTPDGFITRSSIWKDCASAPSLGNSLSSTSGTT